ncbi:MAG TPA: helix-turn-helix transcriptional regulator [Armatimonadota bacterium]
MATNLGPALRRHRERNRLTQQDVVDYARLDRSASYISSIETGKTSPTLAELESIAQVFRTTVEELLQQARGNPGSPQNRASGVQRLVSAYEGLSPAQRSLAIELLELLLERERRGDEEAAEEV